MAVTVALVVTELRMHRDLMEVKLVQCSVQTRYDAGTFPRQLQTERLKDNERLCNSQVRGAAGGEVF